MTLFRVVGRRPHSTCPRGVAATLLTVALGMLVLACEPVDEPLPDPGEEAHSEADGNPEAEALGAPEDDMPDELGQLVERTTPEAERWQPDPRPAEATVTLDGAQWRGASVTYAAAEADSMLVVRVDDEGLSTERINFEPIGLEPIPAGALADLPPLSDVGAPEELAAAVEDRLSECGAEPPVAQVRLATGAPASWEDGAWAQPPRWEAVVTDAAGVGTRVDADTGEPVGDDPCVESTVPDTEGS